MIDLGETSTDLHEKLAELYLRRVRDPQSAAPRRKGKTQDDDSSSDALRAKAMDNLLEFLNTSTEYRAYRVLNSLTKDGELHSVHLKLTTEMPEVRAVLLGRMGNDDEALKIYVYQLKDYAAAEA